MEFLNSRQDVTKFVTVLKNSSLCWKIILQWSKWPAFNVVMAFVWVFMACGILFLLSFVVYGARCWWRSRLRLCATSRKIAGSIPDGVIGIFRWHNPSGHTMALGLTQPLTEMSPSNISWRQRRPVRRADDLTTFMCRLSWNLGDSTCWNPQGLSRPVMRLLFFL